MKRLLFIPAFLLAAEHSLAFYNPEAGRWLSRDPIQDHASSAGRRHVEELWARRRAIDKELKVLAITLKATTPALPERKELITQWRALLVERQSLLAGSVQPTAEISNLYTAFFGNPVSSYDILGLFGPCTYRCGQIGWPLPYWLCLLSDPSDCSYCPDSMLIKTTPAPGRFFDEFQIPCPCPQET